MKNRNHLTAFLFAAILLTACVEGKGNKQDDFAAEAIPVNLVEIKEIQAVTEVTASGLLSSENETKHAFKIGGIIDRIYFDEGQSFNKGDLLASLILTEIESSYAQASLGLDKAKRDFSRAQNLFADSVATLEQWQNAKTALDLAEQQLATVAFNKKYAYIYADKPGMLIKKLANTGEVINGGVPVLVCSDNGKNNWELKVGLSDREWAKTAIGDKAKVMLDAYPAVWWEASVFRKAAAADPNTGSFQVELKLENLTFPAALGMFGKAIIETTEKNTFKFIPFQALVEANGNQAHVFIPFGKDKVKKQTVLLDGFSESGVKVIGGLEDIDAIISGNSAFLNENSTISIIK